MSARKRAAAAKKAGGGSRTRKQSVHTNPEFVKETEGGDLTLLFIDAQDICDPWGKLVMGASTLKFMGAAQGLPPIRIIFTEPARDGSHCVYGVVEHGAHATVHEWSLLRWRTWDGMLFCDSRQLYHEEAGRWYGSSCLARNGETGEYLLLKWGRVAKDGEGHQLWAFGSSDGETWRKLKDRPVYRDHDAFSLIWDAKTRQYVVYQHTYQDWPSKPFRDNAGSDVRRVFHLRTSPDGLAWTPAEDIWIRGKKIPVNRIFKPDEEDPPENEFYLFSVFPYHGRYVGMMKNYLPSPVVTGHGPHNNCEWWVARTCDGWQRPYRGLYANGESDDVVFHAPLTLGGMHLWIHGGKVYGIPENGIFFAGSLSNSAFSTPLFTVPARNLSVNAEFNFHADPSRGMQGQSYLMVEALDPQGKVIPGCEKERCQFVGSLPGRKVPIIWHGGREHVNLLKGQTIRLRFHLRDARVYSVGT